MRTKLIKNLSLLVMAMGFSCVAMAQEEPQFSQYMFNRMSYNPGYAGSTGSICVTLMYRNQWMGFGLDPTPYGKTGTTPKDILFTFDAPIKFLHGGIGLSFTSDKIGFHDNTVLAADYAFKMNWGNGSLSAGLEFELLSSKLDKNGLWAPEDDPLVSNLGESATLIDGGVGAYYQVPGKYYLGFSVKNLLAAHSDVIYFQNARTLYIMGGYEYTPATSPSLRIKPSALIKTADLSTFQADLTCMFDYRNAFWGGLGYRVQDAIYVMAGVRWKKMRLGVSYDFTTSKIGAYKPGRSDGSVEVFLKFCPKIVTPRKPTTAHGNTIWLD